MCTYILDQHLSDCLFPISDMTKVLLHLQNNDMSDGLTLILLVICILLETSLPLPVVDAKLLAY